MRRRVRKLKEKKIKEKFKERVVEFVEIASMDLRGSYKNGVLQACDELCGETKGWEDRRNIWWWNEQVRDAIDRKKKAFKLWCTNRSMERKIIIRRPEMKRRK